MPVLALSCLYPSLYLRDWPGVGGGRKGGERMGGGGGGVAVALALDHVSGLLCDSFVCGCDWLNVGSLACHRRFDWPSDSAALLVDCLFGAQCINFSPRN